MQNLIKISRLLTLALAVFLVACGGGKESSSETQKKLDELKTQQSELNTQIQALEEQLAKEDPKAASAKLKYIGVQAIQPTEFNHYIEVQGSVTSEENVAVSAKMPGTVTKVYVTEGSNVRKGQLLAETDADVLKSNIAEVENSYELAKVMFQKQENLWNQKIGTEMQFLTSKNTKSSLEKRLKALNEQLELSKIKSPIDGTVDMVTLKVGENTAPGMPVPAFRIVNISKLKVKADVAESYGAKIRQGNEVVLSFPDIDKEVLGSLFYVGKVIDPLRRTFTVEAKLANNGSYRPNMIVVMKIIDYRNRKAIAIPVNVMQNTDKGTFVWVAIAEGTKFKVTKREVELGVTYNDQAEIKRGLIKGDQLIITGYQDLNEGQYVNLK